MARGRKSKSPELRRARRAAAADADPRMRQFVPLVWLLVRKFEKGLESVCSPDDLFAIGMVALWKACEGHKEDGGASFKTYAYNGVFFALCHEAKRWTKQNRKINRMAVSIDGVGEDDEPIQIPDRSVPMDATIHSDRQAAEVKRAMECLPPRLKQVVKGRFLDDMTLDEVGSRMGVSRERARQLQAKALGLMRQRLGAASRDR